MLTDQKDEMKTNTVEQSERESDITQGDARNTNRNNCDRSENEMDSDKVEVSEGESDITQKDERNTSRRNSERSENEMGSNHVLVEVSEGDSNITQEVEINSNRVGIREEESDVVGESESNKERSNIIHFTLSKEKAMKKKKLILRHLKL